MSVELKKYRVTLIRRTVETTEVDLQAVDEEDAYREAHSMAEEGELDDETVVSLGCWDRDQVRRIP